MAYSMREYKISLNFVYEKCNTFIVARIGAFRKYDQFICSSLEVPLINSSKFKRRSLKDSHASSS